MASGRKSREARRAASKTPPRVQSKGGTRGRQASPKVLAAAGGVVALVVIAVVLAVVLSGGGGSGVPKDTPTVGSAVNGLPGSTDVQALFKGIPQSGLFLGKPTAPAQMIIYIDLQCPFCQQYETTAMPTLVSKYVRTGKLRIQVEPWAFIGPDSDRGQAAMFAAAKQNKAWQFAEVLYDNQGTENTGWLTDAMIARAAASVTGLNVQQLLTDRKAGSVKTEAKAVTDAANAANVQGTPTVYVGKLGAKPTLVGSNGTVPTLAQTEAAIKTALAG